MLGGGFFSAERLMRILEFEVVRVFVVRVC